MSKFNVVQVGFGPMGQFLAKLLLKRHNINLVGLVDIDPALIGKDLQTIPDFKEFPSLKIQEDLGEIIESNDNIDVVIIATSSFLEVITPMILQVVEKGINVISLCEELSYPWSLRSELSVKIDKAAKENNVTVVGSGINPGYLMDFLPIVLTTPCEDVEKIHVTRVLNSSKRRVPFQKKIGTGLTIGQFNKKILDKEITGHVGLRESMQMIVAALNLDVDEILEFPAKAVQTTEEFDSPLGRVKEGFVKGLHSRGVSKKGDEEIIILDFYAYANADEEYDQIEITGKPNVNMKIIGGVNGDIGTASVITNIIPKVVEAKSGLLTMKDLPAPCYSANIRK
ncbi:MAG: dihydrodipicolinate reductase [Asgard group archaeon]|nr:dihydrodipicolinate reductase [Asgard group archaeon]